MHAKTAEGKSSTLTACPICGHDGPERWLQAPDRFNGRQQLYELVRCSSCSLVWLDNPPKPDEICQHYGSNYDRLIGEAGDTSPLRWQLRRKALSKYKTSGALLDIGCSSGSFLESLKGQSWKLHGIEFSATAAKRAEFRSGAHVFVGDVFSAPFAPESFDVITCFDVLEHLYQPMQVMAKVREWLKPDGIFYVLVPNIESAEAHIFKSYWYGLELPRHLSHFSPASLRYLANSAGLEEISIETHRNPSFSYSLRYLNDEILRRLGLPRGPLATAPPLSILWRIVHKMLRIGLLPVLSSLGAFVGTGESIHAVFTQSSDRPDCSEDEERRVASLPHDPEGFDRSVANKVARST